MTNSNESLREFELYNYDYALNQELPNCQHNLEIKSKSQDTTPESSSVVIRNNHKSAEQKVPPALSLKSFTMKAQLGRGTFGRVYLADKQGSNRKFAIKAIRKDKTLDSKFVQ